MITSKQNAFVKEIRGLKDKKNRDDKNVFTAEGVKLVYDALTVNAGVLSLACTEKGLSSLKAKINIPENVKTEILSDVAFSSLSDEITPQGVIAVIKKPENNGIKADTAVFLDDVSDPKNVGAIIRTAAACGIDAVYYTSDSADPFSPKSVRASMGGIFRVKISKIEKTRLKETVKLPIIVADMGGENVFSFPKKEKFCLVIGNEGRGVSPEIKSVADFTVSIPMENGMESLNAGVSAGIICYLLKRI